MSVDEAINHLILAKQTIGGSYPVYLHLAYTNYPDYEIDSISHTSYGAIIRHVLPSCNDCDTIEDVESSLCGSYCRKCFRKHIKKCEICKQEQE